MIVILYFSQDFTGVFKHLAVISNKLTLIIVLDLKLCLTLLEAKFIDEALDLCLISSPVLVVNLETSVHPEVPPDNNQAERSLRLAVTKRKGLTSITAHNGDFDAWRIFGKQIDNTKLGLWLERVLHTPNATSGDSPKISGMMDLLITQGMWDASLRLAYQLEVAESIESAFGGQEPALDAPNAAPSRQALSNWAEIFEGVWQKHNDAKLLSNKFQFARRVHGLCIGTSRCRCCFGEYP